MKFLVVGAGFAGCTIARVIAEAGYTVDIIDQRPHIGGNAYDYTNEHGIRIHKYGPHYFRTNNKQLLAYLSRFTSWVDGNYYVTTKFDNQLYPFPINRLTINKFFN